MTGEPSPGPDVDAGDVSAGALARLKGALSRSHAALAAADCVAVAGSVARGEAGPQSDLDCVLVVRDGAAPHELAALVEHVMHAVTASGLRPPRAGGMFRDCVSRAQLLDPQALGALDESPSLYGKRLQLLTDTLPVLNEARFRSLRDQVLDWFVRWQPRDRPFAYLASELVRYRRSYSAYQRFCFDHDAHDSWRLRMAKLGSSRLITVAGLLLLLGEGSRHPQPAAWVAARLDLTPLARVLEVIAAYDARLARDVEACYGRLRRRLAGAATRRELLAGRPVSRNDLQHDACVIGAGMDEDLARLGASLNDFLLARRDAWPDWFFHALLL